MPHNYVSIFSVQLQTAAKRELLEESGLKVGATEYLGVYEYFKKDICQHQRRHVFVVETDEPRDTWTHLVKGTGEDQDMVFEFFWQSLPLAKGFLSGDQDKGRFLEQYLYNKFE